MKLLPAFVKLQFRHKTWDLPRLWLPIFLLWPIFFVLFAFVFLIGMLAAVILDTRSIKRIAILFRETYLAACELRGTRVDLENHKNQVFITID